MKTVHFLLSLIFSISTCVVQADEWKSLNGPPAGAAVRDFSVVNSTIYAADAVRLSKSINTGVNWSQTLALVEMPLVVSANPANANLLIVGKLDTIKYSSNGGDSWRNIETLMKPNRLTRSPDVSTFDKVYLGTNFKPDNSSLRNSTDNGWGWSDIGYFHSSATATNITDIAVKTGTNSIEIWVCGTKKGISTVYNPKRGVWRTTDGGVNWNYIGLYDKEVTAIAVHQNIVMAGDAAGKLYQKDGISDFLPVPGFKSTDAKKVNNIQRINDKWYVGAKTGAFRLDNAVWKHVLKGRNVFSIKSDNNTIYAGTDRGLMKSTDYGESWSEVNYTSTRSTGVYSVVSKDNYVLALHKESSKYFIISRYENGVWEKIIDTFLEDKFIGRNIIFHPSIDTVVFAVGSIDTAGDRAVIYKSIDRGLNWYRVFTSTGKGGQIRVEGLSFSNGCNNIFAYGRFGKFSGVERNVIASTDNLGESWNENYNPVDGGNKLVSAIISHPTTTSLFAALPSGSIKGLYQTTNCGFAWPRHQAFRGKPISSLAMDMNNPSYLYTSGGRFVYRIGINNTDTCRIGKFSGVDNIILKPNVNDNLFAIVRFAGKDSIVRYLGGSNLLQSWEVFGDRLPRKKHINQISFSITHSDTLYAASDSGVYKIYAPTKPISIACPDGFNKIASIGSDEQLIIKETFTIESDQTMLIDAGATLIFSPGAQLRVNGHLIVQGTPENKVRFISENPSQRWGGIYLAKDSRADIENVEITGAVAGIIGTKAELNMSNSDIKNCLIGVGLYGKTSEPSQINFTNIEQNAWGIATLDGSDAVIKNSRIAGGQKGVLIEASSPEFYGNTISDNSQVGAVIYANGYARFGSISPNQQGSNIISNNGSAQILAFNGYAFLGYTDGNFVLGGNNTVITPDPYIPIAVTLNNSQMNAMLTNWGTTNVNQNDFITDATSQIAYTTPLYDPEEIDMMFSDAMQYRSTGNHGYAIYNYQNIINYGDSHEAVRAFVELRETYTELLNAETDQMAQWRSYLQTLHQHPNPLIVRSAVVWLAHEYANADMLEEALAKYESALSLPLSNDTRISVLLSKMLLEGYESDYIDAAEETFQQLKTQFPNDERTQLAQLHYELLSSEQSVELFAKTSGFKVLMRELPKFLKAEQKLNSIPQEFRIEQNYPNPFNPSTLIKYQLPQANKVEIKIYNIFGQEVKKLVDEVKDAGYYEIVWNSDNNTGSHVASGVYLYRLIAGSYTSVKKMILMR
ncbi:MAG: T9SS type A sorting domain-containing protein [Bacteroidota bacterium]|nr:T9SS type A sorting domain-containing protein [Bacteroidota bacterium]